MHRLVAVLARCAALVICLVVGTSAPAASADPGAEGDFASRVNSARSARGLDGLGDDAELAAIARRWSQRMANENRLSHNPNLSKEVTQDWERLAENVGVGSSVGDIHEAFMNSASHRINILDSGFTHLGVGVVIDGSGQIWVTQVFMRLRSGGGGSATQPPPPAPTTTARPRPTTTAPPPQPAGESASPPTTRAPRPSPPTTVARAVAATTTLAPAPEVPAPAPPEAAIEASITAVSPSARLVLVLDGLRALDQGR